jgi:DNA processing protein
VSDDSWLLLGLATGLRGCHVDTLLERFGRIDNALAVSEVELARAGLPTRTVHAINNPDQRLIEQCQAWLALPGNSLVTWGANEYPLLLSDLPDAPPLLFVRGDTDALTLPQLAIIGSRSATRGGMETARRFATHLGNAGFSIASGLAAGIDAAAHRGALDASGRTVAVCGTGPDVVYPKQNARLADDIAERGALITEFPPGTPPRRAQFPQRNRLIAGLSVGTLVVEAGQRSGALITARLASEYGREVFAVPGSIHSPTARGCHQLIRSGAKLVESSDDIMEELPGMLARLSEFAEQNGDAATPARSDGRDQEYQRLLKFMGWDPVTVNTIVERSGLTAEEVSSMLLILELEQRVEPLAGGYYIQREEG